MHWKQFVSLTMSLLKCPLKLKGLLLRGLLSKVPTPKFAFKAAVAVKILTLLSPVNAMMQEKSWNVALATELITNATSEISLMKSEENVRFLLLKLASPKLIVYNRNGRDYRANCWLVVS